jgi:hypothetical protein
LPIEGLVRPVSVYKDMKFSMVYSGGCEDQDDFFAEEERSLVGKGPVFVRTSGDVRIISCDNVVRSILNARGKSSVRFCSNFSKIARRCDAEVLLIPLVFETRRETINRILLASL